jgi:hypothetical protein
LFSEYLSFPSFISLTHKGIAEVNIGKAVTRNTHFNSAVVTLEIRMYKSYRDKNFTLLSEAD